MKTVGAVCAILLFFSCVSQAKKPIPLDPVSIAADDSPAILQITYWGENAANPSAFNIDGTGFLVGRDGYFITAAHVLERYKESTGQLGATVHQRDKNGSGIWFDVIEIDRDHDIALCKLKWFHQNKERKDYPIPEEHRTPIVSLKVSSESAKPGEPVVMIGYPLNAFVSPIVQVGNIGATDARLGSVAPFPAGRGELLIVSIAGNHGDSGCPIISLRTGDVVGMIIQYVPAPLMSVTDNSGQHDIPQQSGLMVAVPAKWILDLLQKHQVANMPIEPSEHMVM